MQICIQISAHSSETKIMTEKVKELYQLISKIILFQLNSGLKYGAGSQN